LLSKAKRVDNINKSIIDSDYSKTVTAERWHTPSRSTGEKDVVKIIMSETDFEKREIRVTEVIVDHADREPKVRVEKEKSKPLFHLESDN
jgi:hypothetical protein